MEDGTEVYSTCGEVFSYTDLDFEVGDTYYKGKSKSIRPSRLLHPLSVYGLLDDMEEQLYEEVGEVAFDNLSMPEDKQEELLCIIKNFVDKHTKVSCYKVVDIEECIMEESEYD